MTIDSTDVTDFVSVSIQPTVDVQTRFGSKPYPRLARPRGVDWVLTVRHNDASIVRGKVNKAGAIAVTFKNANNGGPTRGTTVVTFTVTGLIYMGGDNAPGSGDSEFTTIVCGRHDGVNMPATWSVV